MNTLINKTVAISGSTGGIGRELCAHVAELGASELILLDRNAEKSRAFADELSARFPALSIRRITVDMEDIDAVSRAADELLQNPPDYLILNAGAYSIPRHKCSTGFDNVFQINFLSPYFLARKLISAISERGGKIVAVGSIAHNYSKADFNDIDFSTRQKASKVYGNAKRYLMYSLWGLDKHLNNIAIAHPGITFTNITAHYPKLIFAIIKYPMKMIFMKPKKASLSIIEALFCDCAKNEWIGPRCFNVWGKPKKQKVKTATPEEARSICITAEKIYLNIETEKQNEKLYNNVILEDGFSSKPCDFSDTPYLKDRPDIIDVSVGRQLFVDNFLIENTDLTPEYHKAKKIRGQSRSLPRNALGERSFSRRLPQKRWRVVRRGRI